MRTAAENQTNSKKVGYLRLAMVSATTAVFVGLGMVVAHLNAPAAGQPCSVPNSTTHNSAGRTMWCNPTMTGTHDTVWQQLPGS